MHRDFLNFPLPTLYFLFVGSFASKCEMDFIMNVKLYLGKLQVTVQTLNFRVTITVTM